MSPLADGVFSIMGTDRRLDLPEVARLWSTLSSLSRAT